MSGPVANPPRLSSLPDGQDPSGVGRLFREARELPAEELPRLRWRLRTSQQLRAMWPRRMLKAALVVGIAFFMGGVVGAVVAPRWVKRTLPGLSPPTPARQRPRALPHASATEKPPELAPVANGLVPEVGAPTPFVRAPEGAAVVAKPRSVVVPRLALRGPATVPPAAREIAAPQRVEPPPAVVPPALVLSPPVTSPIAVEQTLLGDAMRALRSGGDARTALALVVQHDERFPRGAFAAEATELRIEALLVLGRRDEALAVLDDAPLGALPNRDEQLVVRGELRAAHQRWRDAARDFAEALSGRALPSSNGKQRGLHERALWGHAAARSRLGDPEGARADLELYLRFFPDGLFAATATALLAKGAP